VPYTLLLEIAAHPAQEWAGGGSPVGIGAGEPEGHDDRKRPKEPGQSLEVAVTGYHPSIYLENPPALGGFSRIKIDQGVQAR
jgi:hypothetical protein